MAETGKIYYTFDDIQKIIASRVELHKLKEQGFECIIALGTGGLIPAKLLKTFLNIPIVVLTIKFYDENNKLMSEPDIIQWDQKVIQDNANKKCLIVDEVLDSGSTISYVADRLTEEGMKNLSVAVIHHKTGCANSDIHSSILSKVRNFYDFMIMGNEWIVYPWEPEDINEHNNLAQESRSQFPFKYV